MIFPKNPNPGFFISVEGLDGSGSSTQINLLEKKLKNLQKKVFITKEPTENEIGKVIRKVLTKKLKIPADALQLLFTADRSLHLQKEVIPHLKSGDTVITERYFWSTIAFGSIDMDISWLVELNKNFIQPDTTFFLDVMPAVCIKRIHKSRDDTELFEIEEKLSKVEEGYKKILKKFPNKMNVINGERNVEDINEDILTLILRHPKFKGV